MIIKKKYYVLIIIFFIFFILVLNLFYRKYYYYDNDKENFIGFLELLSYNENKSKKELVTFPIQHKNEENFIQKKNKNNDKYIYIIDKNKNLSLEYVFLNKNNQPYMIFDGVLNLKNIDFTLKNNNGKKIGQLDRMFHNKFIISLSMYSNKINIEFHNNYFNALCYIEGTDHTFYIKYLNKHLKKKNDKEEFAHIFIDSYKLKIGSIHKEYKRWKIKVKEKYKTYLNMYGITFICLHSFQ